MSILFDVLEVRYLPPPPIQCFGLFYIFDPRSMIICLADTVHPTRSIRTFVMQVESPRKPINSTNFWVLLPQMTAPWPNINVAFLDTTPVDLDSRRQQIF